MHADPQRRIVDLPRPAGGGTTGAAKGLCRSYLLPGVGFLLVGLVLLSPLVPLARTHILADGIFSHSPGVCDGYNFLWGYWWSQEAVAQSKTVLHCDWVCPPDGVNLFFHTMNVLPALLTLPIGRVFGPVIGYNAMTWLMLSFAGYSYFLFLRSTFRLSHVPAFAAGCAFGFSPYVLLKAHGGMNLVGLCFWGSALGILVSTYVHDRFTLARGLGLAAFVWATYWTSFVEFFMLGVVCVVVVAVLELRRTAGPRLSIRRRAIFVLPTLIGCASLAFLAWAPSVRHIERPRVDGFGLLDLFSPGTLTTLSAYWRASIEDSGGACMPLSVLVLAFVGYAKAASVERPISAMSWPLSALIVCLAVAEVIVAPAPVSGGERALDLLTLWWIIRLAALALALTGLFFGLGLLCTRQRVQAPRWTGTGLSNETRHAKSIWILALAGFLLTLDVAHGPSAVIRCLPVGGGAFRVFNRFFPFAYFFLLVLASLGLEWLWRHRADTAAKYGLYGLCLMACIECFPFRLQPKPVRQFHIPPAIARRLDKSRRTWLDIEGPLKTDHDTYQVALNMPFAYVPSLSRGGVHDAQGNARQYPVVYRAKTRFSAEEFMAEAKRLNIGYVLFESIGRYRAFPVHTTVLATDRGSILAELAPAP